MRTTLSIDATREISARLSEANREFAARYPGESFKRQPVHTVYGGAHLFKSDTTVRLGALARRALDAYGPNFAAFARALELPGSDELPDSVADDSSVRAAIEADEAAFRAARPGTWLAHKVYTRVAEKLTREPVEDFRIDFEDGYGNRPDAEEDGHAAAAAARGRRQGWRPARCRRSSASASSRFNEELHARSLRTLDIFLTTLLEGAGGALPENFVVTLPKSPSPEQVAALARLFDALRARRRARRRLAEVRVDGRDDAVDHQPQTATLRAAACSSTAARGRCVAAHFGTYDYTASCAHHRRAPAHDAPRVRLRAST